MPRQHIIQLLVLTLCLYLFFFPTTILAEGIDEQDDTIPEIINNYKTCAVTALKRTPQLQRSKMEIEIRHLDEDDSRWSYAPDLILSSYYYFAEDKANISLRTSNYRPWEPYYSLQVRKLISRMVKLKHLQATAQALYKLADTFLQLLVTDKNEVLYKQIVALSQKKLHFAHQQFKSGTATPLALEFEKQRHAFVLTEYEGNIIKHDTLLNGLCIMINLPDSSIFNLNNKEVLEQILGPFRLPGPQNMPQPDNSINLQLANIKDQLQKKRITLAYSKYVPDITFGVRSPDLLNVSVDADKSYYFYTGINLTLWDGKKRSRDITRQKLILRQMRFKNKEIKNGDAIEWLQAMRKYSSAKSQYALAQSFEKLKKLQLKKKKFEYANGIIKLSELLNHQIAQNREKLNTVQKEFFLNQAGLRLRHLSGQLLKDTLNISLTDISYE